MVYFAAFFRHLFGHFAGYLGCHSRTLIKKGEDSIGDEGAETVMRRLGLWEFCSDEVDVTAAVEEARRLLEEKEASLEEAEEAFGVLDEDGDGVIGGEELRSVMRRLGFKEGSELEDCRRMIEVYDEDGDGGICFAEFKKMMEMAV